MFENNSRNSQKILENIQVTFSKKFKNYQELYNWAEKKYNTYCTSNYECNDFIGNYKGNENDNIVDTIRHDSFIEGPYFGLLWGFRGYKKSSYDDFCDQLRCLGMKNSDSMVYREIYLKICKEIIRTYPYLIEICNNKIERKFGPSHTLSLDSIKVMEDKTKLQNSLPILRVGKANITFNPLNQTFDVETESDIMIGVGGCGPDHKPFKDNQTYGCKPKNDE